MKIAIHNNETGGFGAEWIDACRNRNIEVKLVNAYESDIVEQLKDCDAFMWHHTHADYRDLLFAKQLLAALEAKGMVVFPNHATGWHFDDKVGEKYLFEALDIPAVPSHVFYNQNDAHKWVDSTEFPKVFKLRGGAGAQNVRLVHNRKQAHRLINKSFGKGFATFNRWSYCKDRWQKWRHGQDSFIGAIKGLGRLFIPIKDNHLFHHQKGYILFQDFMPGNTYDTRVIVINNEYAIAERRFTRKGDFRASGSGKFSYDNIDEHIIELAFRASKRLGVQSVAFDFIYDEIKKPKIVEISYCFGTHGIYHAPGYWTKDMHWNNNQSLRVCDWILECIIDEIESKKQ